MRAIHISNPGSGYRLVLAEEPRPVPGRGQVLIAVAAAGLNNADLLQARGFYPPPPGASPILGLEVSGTIAALGDDVEGFAVGDAVCALLSGGGYADHALADAGSVLPVPAGMELVAAAALPEAAFTAWTNIVDTGRLAPGETLLVHGGTSGIGSLAIQMAAAFGVTVLATAGSAEKCAACVALGATRAINYKDEDFVEATRDATGGRGADVILDMVGGEYVARNLKACAPDGRIVQIAFLGGAKVTLDPMALMRNRITLTGSTLRPREIAFKAAIADQLRQRVWPLIATGRIRPVIDSVFPLADAAQAHARMESSAHIGKSVLKT